MCLLTFSMQTKFVEIALFPGQDVMGLLSSVDNPFRKKLAQFKDLFERMLTVDFDKRITPSEALKHPFITEPCVD